MTAATNVATRYPADQPACTVPPIVVRFSVGTYSATSIFATTNSDPKPIQEMNLKMIKCSYVCTRANNAVPTEKRTIDQVTTFTLPILSDIQPVINPPI